MMRDMIIHHRHLSPTDTGTDVTHTIVISNLLMLIIRITLTILRGIHHNLAPMLLILSDERTTSRSSNHLVTVERQHAILSECAQHLSFILRPESLCSILHYRNTVFVRNLHDTVNLVRHTIQSHRHNRLWRLTRLCDTVFYSHLHQLRIHIPCLLLRIHKNRRCP